MQSAHMMSLEAKHANLDAQLSQENSRPAPDDTLIARLKKEKLRIKQLIAGI
jgi:hypothetical protein